MESFADTTLDRTMRVVLSEIERGIAFTATIRRDRALVFVLSFLNEHQRKPSATLNADSKYSGLRRFDENSTNRNKLRF